MSKLPWGSWFLPLSRVTLTTSLHFLIAQLCVREVDHCDALSAAWFAHFPDLGMVGCKPRTGRKARLWWALQLLIQCPMPEALEKLEGYANTTTGNGTKQIIEIPFGFARIWGLISNFWHWVCHISQTSLQSFNQRFVAQKALPKLALRLLISNHRCPMSLERCLEGLVPVGKALNVLHGLPQNTGCLHPEKQLGHGLDMFGHVVRIGGTFANATTPPSYAKTRGFHRQFSSEKKCSSNQAFSY